LDELAARLEKLRARVEQGLTQMGAVIFGNNAKRVPNTCYFAFKGIDGETLIIELDKLGFGVAAGAACSSANPEPSATLLAMGIVPEIARGAVRFSLGAANGGAIEESHRDDGLSVEVDDVDTTDRKRSKTNQDATDQTRQRLGPARGHKKGWLLRLDLYL
jgi:hypothetical protein